jgi:hypothetical protein
MAGHRDRPGLGNGIWHAGSLRRSQQKVEQPMSTGNRPGPCVAATSARRILRSTPRGGAVTSSGDREAGTWKRYCWSRRGAPCGC